MGGLFTISSTENLKINNKSEFFKFGLKLRLNHVFSFNLYSNFKINNMWNKFILSIFLLIILTNVAFAQNFNLPIQAQVLSGQFGTLNSTSPTNVPVNSANSSKRTTVDNNILQKKAADSIQIERQNSLPKIDTPNNLKTTSIFGSDIFNNKTLNFEPNLNIATPQSYIIGPEDELIIDINGYSEEHYTLNVNAEGYIKIPRVGNVFVSGLTLEEVKKRLIFKLSTIYFGLKKSSSSSNNANGVFATISLGNIKTIRVGIQGEVKYPGTYSLSSLSSVMNALYLSGGPSEKGTFREIQLIRNKKVIATIDLYDYLLNGILKNDYTLHDQDIIRVGLFKRRVELKGKVKRSFWFEIFPNETLDKVINEFGGGYLDDAFKEQVKITRFTSKERKIIDLNSELFSSFIPNSGDVIDIETINTERFENKINIVGEVFRPGDYSLEGSPTIFKLIERAGGLKENAFKERIIIQRINADLSLSNLSVNYQDILSNPKNDIKLNREDVINVYSVLDLKELFTVTIHGEINHKISTINNLNPDTKVESKAQKDDYSINENESEILEENKSKDANNKLINRQIKLTLPFIEKMTVEDLILKAGGLRESAATGFVEIVRRKKISSNENIETLDSKIAEITRFPISNKLQLDNTASKFELMPFDDVFIRSSPNYQIQQFITLKGQISYPGVYGIEKKDERLSEIVKRAGGLNMQAYKKGAKLLRQFTFTEKEKNSKSEQIAELQDNYQGTAVKSGSLFSVKQEIIAINLERALSNPYGEDDLIILDGDVLEIPIEPQTVKISGEVLYPTNVKYSSKLNFNDYVTQAGGITSNSVKRRSYVIYSNGSIDRTRQFLFFRSYPKVEKGSEIIIPNKVKSTSNFQQIASIVAIFTGSITSIIGVVTLIKATAK
jgi:protein involved in polysaccharide export with SLBB domain